ncbi:uncharacterized protein TNCV_2553371 [Trichonephila clavipes]|nr:uncharacterized protein TNCV_2553371 [Trichonephila clavipes]
MTLHSPTENSLAVLNHKILEANSQVQNVKLGGHQTCLSINRLWHELWDMLRRLVGTTALDIMIVQFSNEKLVIMALYRSPLTVAAIRHISHSCLDPNDFTVVNCIVKGHASLSSPSLRLRLCSRFTLIATYTYFDPKDFSPHPIDSVKGHTSLSPLAQQKAKKIKQKRNIDSHKVEEKFL